MVNGYSGDAGNALMDAQTYFVGNGMMFTTSDSDNDYWAYGNCGNQRGGWWYQHCSTSELNQDADGRWKVFGTHLDVRHSHMLVKLN